MGVGGNFGSIGHHVRSVLRRRLCRVQPGGFRPDLAQARAIRCYERHGDYGKRPFVPEWH